MLVNSPIALLTRIKKRSHNNLFAYLPLSPFPIYFQVRELLTQVRVIKVLVAVAFTAKLRSGNKSFEATHY